MNSNPICLIWYNPKEDRAHRKIVIGVYYGGTRLYLARIEVTTNN